MPISIIHESITEIKCDAIVNPTDSMFSGSGGTDLAIHTAAGELLAGECAHKERLNIGEVSVTDAYKLPCRNIIHTFGPVWQGGEDNEAVLLRSCYLNSLFAARKIGAKSVAFPLISAGTFCFPKDRVLKIAINAISDFLEFADEDMDVILCVVDPQVYELSEKLALEEHLSHAGQSVQQIKAAKRAADLSEFIKNQDDSFAVTLLKLIDCRGMKDSECYKKANISKQTFWKIMNESKYRPGKATVLAFAIALRLNLDESEQLLRTVGMSFSHSSTFDMIIEFYISKGIYDVFEINAALYKYGQPILGC